MKNLLLINGIIFAVVCVVSLLFAWLSRYGYYHVLDGSSGLYAKLHQRAVIFLIVGIVSAVVSVVCFVVRAVTK